MNETESDLPTADQARELHDNPRSALEPLLNHPRALRGFTVGQRLNERGEPEPYRIASLRIGPDAPEAPPPGQGTPGPTAES